ERRSQAVLNATQAAELAGLGVRIEGLYGLPMDIEWAWHADRFFILQARPITALRDPSPPTEAWNDSLAGDYLWTSGNVGEAVPDVMTPCTWSLVKIFLDDTLPMPSMDGHSLSGNIGGRLYINLSSIATLAAAFGMNPERS